MNRKDINEFIRTHQDLSRRELADKCGISLAAITNREHAMGLARKWVHPLAGKTLKDDKPEPTVETDRAEIRAKQESGSMSKRYKEALAVIEAQDKRMSALLDIKGDNKTFAITPYKNDTTSEATAVVLASDWHVEERVDAAKTNGLNEYSLEISKARATQFFQRLLKLVDKERADVHIEHIVLALLGDFITSNIHEELPAICALGPVKAILRAQEYIASGIRFLLANSKYRLTIVCTCGNHARITKKIHWASEQENSLEYMMYCNLAEVFKNEKRVTFLISEAYHYILPVYDTTIRFHHGHTIKYQGGIGGLTVPVNNKIYKWSRTPIKAELDCFGHFHQLVDGGNFICNGSMIGYSNMGALFGGFERPQQSLFLIDKHRGRTVHIPILFSV